MGGLLTKYSEKQLCNCSSQKNKKSSSYISSIDLCHNTQKKKKKKEVDNSDSYFDSIYNYFKTPYHDTKLQKCYGDEIKKRIATFRCSIVYENDNEINDIYKKYPKLESHLKSIDSNYEGCTINYIACAKCLDSASGESFLFTLHQNGWINDHQDRFEKAHIVLGLDGISEL